VELHQRPQAARGALLQFEWLSKTRGTQAFRAWRGRPGRVGLTTRTGPGEARGHKAVGFRNPQALSNVQAENLSCARDQVVVARPPALTPPTHGVIGALL
jgi:hypothetical protein